MKKAIFYLTLGIIGFVVLMLLSTIAIFIWDDVPAFIMILNCFLTYFAVGFIKPTLSKFMKIK